VGAKQRLATTMSSISSGGTKVVPTRGLVEEMRVVKDEGELARIELAAGIADVALAQVKEHLTEKVTEQEFALELDFEMRRRGADGVAFETIVASGPNSASRTPDPRPDDPARRRRRGRLRGRGRRLPVRHDADALLRHRRLARAAGSARRRPRRPARRRAGGQAWCPGRRRRCRLPRIALDPPATATPSSTGAATASASRFTRPQLWRPAGAISSGRRRRDR